MNYTEIKEIEEQLRVITTGEWVLDLETQSIRNKTGSIGILSGEASQMIADMKLLSKSPVLIQKLIIELEFQIRDTEYWKIMAQRALSESRSTKLDTIKGCIRLLRTVYLPSRMAKDVMTQAKSRLEEFKTKDLSELMDRQDGTLFFDEEPPQIP